MKNYTILNCNSRFWTSLDCASRCSGTNEECSKRTDCLLKEIVHLCFSRKQGHYTMGERFLADDILKKIQIKEVENE